MSGSRIKTAGRFKPCVHMACFDLETFVELNQRSKKWQCPICLKNYSLEHIIIDPYFNRITSLMKNCGEDVTEIDVKPDGSWRARAEGDLVRWHLPDGSLCSKMDIDIKPHFDTLKQIKQEVGLEGQSGLRLGIKRHNGIWEISKSEEHRPTSSGNHVLENIENHHQNIMQMSSSATGSYRDGDDPSVTMENGTHFEFTLNNGNEFDSLSFGFSQLNNEERNPSLQLKEADVIVLSDSEDDNVTVYNSNLANGAAPSFSAAPLSATYPEDHGLHSCGTSSHGVFNNDTDDFGMPPWSLQMGAQPTSSFQLFGTDMEPQEGLVDMQQNPLGCPSIGSYSLFPDGDTGEVSQVQDISTCHSNNEMNGSLVNNPLTFSDDPSLQIFLPSRPGDTPLQNDANHRSEITDSARSDDWISLSLGGTGGQGESASTSGVIPARHPTSRGSRIDALATASLLLSGNEDRPNRSTRDSQRSDGPTSHPRQERSNGPFSHPRQQRSNGPFSHPRQQRSIPFSRPRQQRSNIPFSHPRQQRSNGPFSHPRQPRSARPRLYLSIDTDSD